MLEFKLSKSSDGQWRQNGRILPPVWVHRPKLFRGLIILFFGWAFGIGWGLR